MHIFCLLLNLLMLFFDLFQSSVKAQLLVSLPDGDIEGKVVISHNNHPYWQFQGKVEFQEFFQKFITENIYSSRENKFSFVMFVIDFLTAGCGNHSIPYLYLPVVC